MPRYSYEDSCVSKRAFRDKPKALEAIRNLGRLKNSKRRKRGDEGLRAYRCLYCDQWHIGHLPNAGAKSPIGRRERFRERKAIGGGM